MTHRSPGRFLAPLALIAAVVAVALVVSSATGGEGDDGTAASGTTTTSTGKSRTTRSSSDGEGGGGTTTTASQRKTYTVKAGDTLGSIADDAGITIEELQELNPEVDPQSLTVGQRLRLRR